MPFEASLPPRLEHSPSTEVTSAPLRVAILSYRSAPNVGGQGVYVEYLSRALVAFGHTVDVISGPPYPNLDPAVGRIELPSLDLYAQPHHGHYALRPKHLRSLTDTYEYFGHLSGKFVEPYTFGRRAYDYLRRHRSDYDVILDNQCLAEGVLRVQTRLGLPLVTVIHHPITQDRRLALEAEPRFKRRLLIRRWYAFHRMQIRVARRLQTIISPSECAKAHIGEEFGVDPTRITAIPLGIDRTFFKPDPAVQRLPNRVVTTASADTPLKGLRFLVEAYGKLLDSYPDLELVVIGSPRKGGTSRQIRKLGLADKVQFKSGLTREELAREFQTATMLVSPSLYEGFGLPAAEAMSCGTPVVVTDGGALPEVAGNAGVIVPKGDADALAHAIASLLDDPERREAVAAACLKRAEDTFNWRNIAPIYDAVFRDAISDAC
jgi:glycosyltransferase involved in cell wall biosynthesis